LDCAFDFHNCEHLSAHFELRGGASFFYFETGDQTAKAAINGKAFEVGMMRLCVEAYIGAVGGHDGVKLEEQVLITGFGCSALIYLSLMRRLFLID